MEPVQILPDRESITMSILDRFRRKRPPRIILDFGTSEPTDNLILSMASVCDMISAELRERVSHGKTV